MKEYSEDGFNIVESVFVAYPIKDIVITLKDFIHSWGSWETILARIFIQPSLMV